MNQGSNQQLQKLGTQNAQFQQAGINKLAGFESSVKAPYEQQVWDYNQNQPYQTSMRAAAALTGGGLQNLSGGLGGLGKLTLDMGLLEKFGMIGGGK